MTKAAIVYSSSALMLLSALLACPKNDEEKAAQQEPAEAPPKIASPLPPEEPPPADQLVIPPMVEERKQRVIVNMSSCDRAQCEIRFDFGLPMVKADQLKTAKPVAIQFTPQQNGEFSWQSPSVLAFKPAKDAMNWGNEIRVSIAEAIPLLGEAHKLAEPLNWSFQIPYYNAGGKIAFWPVLPNRPRLVGFLNGYSDAIGQGPLYLLYDQPVDANAIAAQLTIYDDSGSPMPTEVKQPTDSAQVHEDNIDLRHLVAVRLTGKPKEDSAVVVAYPTWPESIPPEQRTPDIEKYNLTVKTAFGLEKSSLIEGDHRRTPLSANWLLKFVRGVSLSMVRKHIQVTPKAKSISVSRRWDGIHVNLGLEPGLDYQLGFAKEFTDALGNPLEEPVQLSFRSQDLKPSLHLPATAVTLEHGAAHLATRVLNVGKLSATAAPFAKAEDFVKALARGKQNSCRKYTGTKTGKELKSPAPDKVSNQTKTLQLSLRQKGLVCVDLRAPGRGSEAEATALKDSVLTQVTDLGMTVKLFDQGLFVWVTHLSKPNPVKAAQVRLLDAQGKQLATAITADNGVAKLDAKEMSSEVERPYFVVASLGDDQTVTRLEQDLLSHAWQYGLRGVVRGSRKLQAAVFTERGAYRPGEVVHIKAIVAPGQTEQNRIQIQVRDPRGQSVLDKTPALDKFGTASLDLKLKDKATVGQYALRVSSPLDNGVNRYTVRQFRVEEYRVPTFEVEVTSDHKTWGLGKAVGATIKANYMHGGSLGGRQVRYSVDRVQEEFAPASLPGYRFSLPADSTLEGSIKNGSQRLDGQGQLSVEFTPDHPSHAGPMRYVVEASVTDVDRQNYAGRMARVVHPAGFYIGVRQPSSAVLPIGDTLDVAIVAVRPDGTPMSGAQVRAQLERIDHHTTARMSDDGVQLRSRPVTVVGEKCLVTTRHNAVNCRFKLTEAGQFRIHAWALDKNKRNVQTGFLLTVSGDNQAAWPRFDQDRIELVADKPSYKPGDVARLVPQTPFKNARGLLTLEQNRVLEHRLFEIKDNTPALEVPITAAMAPNVFVSVVLLRGRIHSDKDASGFETGAPSFKMGYANLRVEPVEQKLALQVTPNRTQANPGDDLQIDFAATDAKKAPVAGQVTVMVVDEAVLGLTGYRTPKPVTELYAERALGVRTAESRLDLPHAKRTRHERIFAGGDGGEGFALDQFPSDLRKLFKSTAYYNPSLVLDAQGKGQVTIKLPDNITTYRIMAVVVDQQARAGSADSKVVVRKPLMVQPVAPRFVYPGDQLRVEALVFNGTEKKGNIEVKAGFEGLKLLDKKAKQKQEVASGASGTFAFQVRVPQLESQKENAVIRFAAKLGKHSDAVEIKLPLLNPGSRRTLVASKLLTTAGDLRLDLPGDRQKGTTEVEVLVSSTALTELKDAVQYLMRYPNGCIEQTTSTAYPLVVLEDLLPEMGVTVSEEDLKKYRDAGIRRILSFQTTSGGLAYWPGSDSPHAFATAFGLTALIAAKKRGYDIPNSSLAGMADYLEKSLRQGKISGEMPHGGMADADTRALFVMTLGRLGRPQPAYISSLWRKKEQMTAFGLAFLAEAVAESKGNTALLKPILAEVKKTATEQEKEAWFETKRKGGWSMDSPLRTHAASLLAFADTAPRDNMGGKLLQGLLKRRKYGLWGNTQENVFGIMGVAAIAGGSGGEGAEPAVKLALNTVAIDPEKMEAVSKRVRRIRMQEDDLSLKRGQATPMKLDVTSEMATPINVILRAQYEAELNESNRAPRANGFTIKRLYESTEGQSLDGKPIKLGSLVRVRLLVTAEGKQNYVAIDDKLPAGLEPMNMNLKTTEKVSLGEMTPVRQRSQGLLSYTEMRDERVAFYVDDMASGEYEYVYIARATTPGTFLRPAAHVEAMYQPEVSGDTAIDEITVK